MSGRPISSTCTSSSKSRRSGDSPPSAARYSARWKSADSESRVVTLPAADVGDVTPDDAPSPSDVDVPVPEVDDIVPLVVVD